jgi:gamma-glutamylcyclotransferase (GGCT)/AIG2-like uncharacterized protein YtfP
MDVVERLAVYGTLAPGRSNHHLLADLKGRWLPGQVRGTRYDDGWHGYPGFVVDERRPPVDVLVFEASDLADHWRRLDAFEGPGYRRVQVSVETTDGPMRAWIYELVDAPG